RAAVRDVACRNGRFPPELALRDFRIVVDCAHGAGYDVAPRVFHELGADVVTVAAHPDVLNINHGVGSTHPRYLMDQVRTHAADLGIALDGDGDRLLMVDGAGRCY